MNASRLKIYSWTLLTLGLLFVTNPIWFKLLGYDVPLYDLRRILLLGLLLVLALLGIVVPTINATIQNLCRPLPTWVKAGFIAIVTLGLISSFLAPLPRYALLQVAFYSLIAFDCLVVAAFVQIWGQNQWQWLLTCLGLTLTSLCITHYSLLGHWLNHISQLAHQGFILSLKHSVFRHMTVYPTFTNPRFLAQALTWTWPLLVMPIMIAHSSRAKQLSWAIPFFILASLVWSLAIYNNSRALMLEWLIIPILVIVFFRKLGLHWLKWQLLTAALGLAIYLGLHLYFIPHLLTQAGLSQPSAPSSESQLTSHTRLFFFHAAWLMAWHHPILGVGPMHYTYYGFHLNLKPGRLVAHPHNAWLSIAAQWGLLVALIASAIFIQALVSIIKQLWQSPLDTTRKTIRLGITASFAAGILHACVSGIIIMPLSQALLVVIIGWMIGEYMPKPAWSGHINTTNWIISAVLVLIATSILIYGVYPMWGHWSDNLLSYAQQTGSHKAAPNFWSQGFIELWPS